MLKHSRFKSLSNRLAGIVLASLLMINNVWASVHTNLNTHQNHHMTHSHADLNHIKAHISSSDELLNSVWFSNEEFSHNLEKSNYDHHESYEHDKEHGYHVHLHLFLVENLTRGQTRVPNQPPLSLETNFSSLTYSPPVPPPTI